MYMQCLTQWPSSVASTSFPSLIFPEIWLTLSLLPRNGCRKEGRGKKVARRRRERGERKQKAQETRERGRMNRSMQTYSLYAAITVDKTGRFTAEHFIFVWVC